MMNEQKRREMLKAARDAIKPEDLDEIADVFAGKTGQEAHEIAAKSRALAEQLRGRTIGR